MNRAIERGRKKNEPYCLAFLAKLVILRMATQHSLVQAAPGIWRWHVGRSLAIIPVHPTVPADTSFNSSSGGLLTPGLLVSPPTLPWGWKWPSNALPFTPDSGERKETLGSRNEQNLLPEEALEVPDVTEATLKSPVGHCWDGSASWASREHLGMWGCLSIHDRPLQGKALLVLGCWRRLAT